MARPFSEAERVAARNVLLREGRRLFAAGGTSALSMSRLTAAAGIAKTSFYAFFPSREALILDLLAEEAPGVRKRVFVHLDDVDRHARDALRDFLHALLQEYRSNTFLNRLILEPATLANVARRVRAEDLQAKAEWMDRPLREFFDARMAAGEITCGPVETLIDLVRSVSLLSLHRDRFGTDERFHAAANALIELVTEGIAGKDSPS